MLEEIDSHEALSETPRPHYLEGISTYELEGEEHVLHATVRFSSEGNPSIADRVKRYATNPHVNAGDVCFAVWNGAHIISEKLGYSERILVDEIRIIPSKIVPPDTPLDLEVRVRERERRTDRSNRSYELGNVIGKISLDGEVLSEVSSNYLARKE